VLQEARHRRVRARILAAAVEVMLACDDRAGARSAADELDTIANLLDTPFIRATAAQARAAVLLGENDPAAALTAGRTAAELWRALAVPYEAARAQVLIAHACIRLGDRDTADLEFDAAHRTFTKLGAKLDSAQLQSARSRPRPDGGLTARELQILRLVATGRTNRAIADELALSEKTIARHISNIFSKLDVSSRAAATAYAFEHHLTGPST
jgi:DNA-binding NarL/FixJ family response regulator